MLAAKVPTHGFYFAFNLEELTEEVAFGGPGHEANVGTRREFWDDVDLGMMLFDPGEVEFVTKAHVDEASLATQELLAGCSLNDDAIANARDVEGFRSRMTDPDGADRGPTILFVPEEKLRAVRLTALQYQVLGKKTDLGYSSRRSTENSPPREPTRSPSPTRTSLRTWRTSARPASTF